MKVIHVHTYGGPEVLVLDEIAMPQPQQGQVRIKVAAAGVNYADLMQRQNTYPVPMPLPFVPGSEVAGTVDALGPQVSDPPIGTRVVAAMADGGGYAEYALANVQNVIPIPDQLEFAPATALFVQGLTAELLLEDAPFQAGAAMLVTAAAGGVGSLLLQLGKLRGAGQIIAAAGSAEKLALARQLGADVVIDYTAADWHEQVLVATNGAGVAVAFDAVGGAIGMQALATLAPFGKLMVYGASSGVPTAYSVAELSFKNLTVQGFTLPTHTPEQIGGGIGRILRGVASGAVRLTVGDMFPLAHAAEAHRAVAERRTVGKIVLAVE